MSNHTPGPWLASGWEVYSPHGERVADCGYATVASYEREPNARLIAAAPDLLEAARHLQEIYRAADEKPYALTEIDWRDAEEALDVAIDKAEEGKE